MNIEEVENIANIARIALSNKRFTDRVVTDLNNILAFIQEISEIETTNVPLVEHLQSKVLHLRKDDISYNCCKVDGFFLVPKVLE